MSSRASLSRTLISGAWLAGASASFALHADEPPSASGSPPVPTPASTTLILGTVSTPDYPGSDDRAVAPLVLSRFTLGTVGVEIEGTEARFDLARGPVLRGGPLIGIVAPRDDGVASAAVGALDDIDAGVELGGYVGFERAVGGLPEGTLSGHVAARRSVSDGDGGSSATARLDYFFVAARPLRFVLNVEVNVMDDARAERWFGIDAVGAVASGLPRFEAGEGVRDVGAGVGAILSFSRAWGLYGRVGISRLLGDANDSPVTEVEGRADQWLGGLGVVWSPAVR